MSAPYFNPGNPYYDPTVDYYGYGPGEGVLGTLDLNYITDDEQLILGRLRAKILFHQLGNRQKQLYYEANQIIQHLDIAVPRILTDIGTAVGWAGTTVDVLDERIDFLGWECPGGELDGLDEAYDFNNLNIESNFAHVDALTTGVSFVSVGNDEDGNQIVYVESSSNATVLWDYKRRRSIAGLSQTRDEWGIVVMETLYLQDANITFERDPLSRNMEITSRDQHNCGRCFMTKMPNRSRPYQVEGRSEITRSVRYYTDAAVRTMLGMEVNREFYTAPQRMILNARPEDFGVTPDMTGDQKFRRGLTVAMGMVNIVPGRQDQDDGDPVSVHEFKPQPPTPYIEQVKAYSIQMSAETGIPATMFGFVTDNPVSADAIAKGENRLVRRSRRRIDSFSVGWLEVARLILLARDGTVDETFMRELRARFGDPTTPARAASADEVQKYVASGVWVPDSTVTYDRSGLSPVEQAQMEADRTKYDAKQQAMAQQQADLDIKVAAASKPPTPPGGGGNVTPSPTKKPATNGSG